MTPEGQARLDAFMEDVKNGAYTVRYTRDCHCKIITDAFNEIVFYHDIDGYCSESAIICGTKSGEMVKRMRTSVNTFYLLMSTEGEAREFKPRKIKSLYCTFDEESIDDANVVKLIEGTIKFSQHSLHREVNEWDVRRYVDNFIPVNGTFTNAFTGLWKHQAGVVVFLSRNPVTEERFFDYQNRQGYEEGSGEFSSISADENFGEYLALKENYILPILQNKIEGGQVINLDSFEN